jgi:glutathione peroxidase
MKKTLAVLGFLASFSGIQAQPYETFHDFTQLTIVHDSLHLSDYAGKKVLVVNTASYCGYTYELGDLRILDSLYGGPDFAIICFPCNDFGGQEPYDDSTIQQFYLGNYHVGYQLMSKISIKAPDTAEVYKWLQRQSRNGVADANVTWNFHKFCIDEAGHWVRHFPEMVNPLDTAIVNWILSPNTTGIYSNSSSAEIVLLGNPSHGKISVEIKPAANENFSVELYDLGGRRLENIFSGSISGSKNIDYTPENLKTGIYFLKVESASASKVLKVCYIQ